MIGVFISFRSEAGLDRSAVMAIAEQAAPAFEGMPGLRSKAFTYDPESGAATNFYVWDSEEAARAFFSPELAERVTGLYGVAPEIRFVEIAALVENGVATPASPPYARIVQHCTNCGAPRDTGANFCGNCGHRFADEPAPTIRIPAPDGRYARA